RLVGSAELADHDAIAAREAELRRVDTRRDPDGRRDGTPQLVERAAEVAPHRPARGIVELDAFRAGELLPPLREDLALIRRRRAECLERDEREPARVDIGLPRVDLGELVVIRALPRVVQDRLAEALRGRGEDLGPRARLEQLDELAHDIEVERVERTRAFERAARAFAIVHAIAKHEPETQLLARLLLRRR